MSCLKILPNVTDTNADYERQDVGKQMDTTRHANIQLVPFCRIKIGRSLDLIQARSERSLYFAAMVQALHDLIPLLVSNRNKCERKIVKRKKNPFIGISSDSAFANEGSVFIQSGDKRAAYYTSYK